MTIVLAVFAGLALGYVLERGDMCFHSTWRGLLMSPRRTDLFGAYVLLLLISVPTVQLMRWFGWIDPVIPSFFWKANIVGGLVFGVGMVIAATCVTGLFYKLGHGMLGTLVGVAAWMTGDIVVFRGPLSGLRDRLTDDVVLADGNPATVNGLLGPAGVVLLIAVGIAAAVYVWRSNCGSRGSLWNWVTLGVAAAAVFTVAWLFAAAHDQDYPFGTAGLPTFVWDQLRGNGSGSWWLAIALVSIVPGSFIAATRADTMWIRGETLGRFAQIGVGAFVMGCGAAIAGGCNLGHSMVGVPLLSVGSIVTTIALAGGIAVGHYALSALATDKITDRREPVQSRL